LKNHRHPSQATSLPKIALLGGKGGVGKTTLSAGLGLAFAERGERVLLLSTDPAHSLSDLLEQPLGDTPREVRPGLHARELDPEVARDAYLKTVRENIRRFTQPEFLQEADRQVMLAGQHPGVMESALFQALCQCLDEAEQWDRIIVDTAPTGHTLHLLSLPQSMGAWTEALLARQGEGQGGPEAERWQKAREVLEARRALFERTRDRLQDPTTTAFLLVANDDRLSILEAERARETLNTAGVHIPCLLLNRSDGMDDEHRKTLQQRFPAQHLHTIPGITPPPHGLPGLEAIATQLRSIFNI